ncbi:MAG: hypothetical protein RLZZ301_1621 [Bacteroidota bacterium]|jgi:uncharacterized protein YdeI (YjbR/CyaY-like superfamily)
MQTDPRVDLYIEKAAEFAQPILRHLRQVLLHADLGLEETIKWNFPNYTFNGKIICSYAAFKKHCVFGFWQGALLTDLDQLLQTDQRTAMGNLGKITHIEDLPTQETLLNYLTEAIALSQQVVAPKKAVAASYTKTSIDFPDYFPNKQLAAAFDAFSPSHRKEYILWIEGAKTQATKQRRLEKMHDQLAEKKTLNWKYEK